MVKFAKHEIFDHLTTADLDQLADRILTKASDSLLDKALEKRLQTIEAKRLINALARAERLGYEPGDVDEEADLAASTQKPSKQQGLSGHAYVQAPPRQSGLSSATASSTSGTGGHVAPPSAPALSPALAQPIPHCGICFRRFTAQSAYEHHIKGKVCTRSPSSPGGFKYNCQHCGQGFTTVMGLQYVSRKLPFYWFETVPFVSTCH